MSAYLVSIILLCLTLLICAIGFLIKGKIILGIAYVIMLIVWIINAYLEYNRIKEERKRNDELWEHYTKSLEKDDEEQE